MPHSEELLWLFRGGVSDLFSEGTSFENLPSHRKVIQAFRDSSQYFKTYI
jgi:hypothetical protein